MFQNISNKKLSARKTRHTKCFYSDFITFKNVLEHYFKTLHQAWEKMDVVEVENAVQKCK